MDTATAATGNDARLHRVEEAAKILSLSRPTVYWLMCSGELASVRIGRARRIPHRALVAFVESLTTASTAAAPLEQIAANLAAFDHATLVANGFAALESVARANGIDLACVYTEKDRQILELGIRAGINAATCAFLGSLADPVEDEPDGPPCLSAVTA